MSMTDPPPGPRISCAPITLPSTRPPARGTLEEQRSEIGHSFPAKVLSPPILELHRLMVSIGRTFPATGRLFFEAGPETAYSVVASWIAKQQKQGLLVDEDPYRLAVLF